jgi:hypothetical protein
MEQVAQLFFGPVQHFIREAESGSLIFVSAGA